MKSRFFGFRLSPADHDLKVSDKFQIPGGVVEGQYVLVPIVRDKKETATAACVSCACGNLTRVELPNGDQRWYETDSLRTYQEPEDVRVSFEQAQARAREKETSA